MTRRRVVIADANVLINLLHVGRLDLCGAIPGFEFVVPENVQQEVSRPEHRSALEQAVESGNLRIETVTGVASLALYAELTARMGRGEGVRTGVPLLARRRMGASRPMLETVNGLRDEP